MYADFITKMLNYFLVVVTVGKDLGTYTSGGPLGLVNYIYHNIFFFWDLNLGPSVGTVDGLG